jgi:predicted RecB family endonuclease
MKRPDFADTAARDLANHMGMRVMQVVQDFMDRTKVIDLPGNEATLLAVSTLLSCAAAGSNTIGLSEKAFLTLCHRHWMAEQEDETTG